MAARRLLIVMLVLLFISTLAAALVPPRERTGEATQGTDTAPEAKSTMTETAPRGRLLAASVDADSKKVKRIPVRIGDQLSLQVSSSKPDQVEIPALGLIGAVSPDAPALFDILAKEPGSFRARLVEQGRVAAVIEVSKRAARRRKKGRGPGR